MLKKWNETIRLDVIIISLIIMGGLSVLIALNPDSSVTTAKSIFALITNNMGSLFLWFGLFSVLAILAISFSKYGQIRLGEGKPEYSTVSWITMIISSGIGAATTYWAYTEWAFYYMAPPFGIEPYSTQALEWGTAYNIFHWGISAWSMYALTALPIAYSFYIRKSGSLKLSVILEDIIGKKLAQGIIGKLVDITFIFSAIGGLGITLALSIPLVSLAFTEIFNINDSFGLQVGIVLFISIIYSFSSYLGVGKGMQTISNANGVVCVLFLLFVLFVGPTQFIIDNMTNALGTMFQNYIKMSLWTDPIVKSDFPRTWTMFFWVYWLTYTPFVGIFIAKISRGRTLREMLLGLVFFGSLGTTMFFGIIGSYSMSTFLSGAVNVPEIINNQDGYQATLAVMRGIPFSGIALTAFAVMTILFLATTLDSAAFTMATTTTKVFNKQGDPSPFLRLFWCAILSFIPLTLMYIKAPLSTIQTSAFIGTVPLILILMVMIFMLFKWMHTDYSDKSAEEIFRSEREKASK